MSKPLLQILILQLSSLHTSSFFKVHDSAPYRGVFQSNVFCYSLLQARQFFSLSKRVLCSGYSRYNFFLTGSVRLITLPRWLKWDSWLNCLPSRKIVNSSPVLLLIFITLVFITLVSIPYWWFSLSRHLKNGKTENWKNGNLAFNTASLESGKWKKINIQKALPRIRSEQYFICEIFRKRFYQIYKALYGDAKFVSLSGAQIWSPETNRNICFWVFLLMPEFFPLGTHKD